MSIIYLYIKHCNCCGLKYFGKTTNRNPFKYSGSGVYWKRHIKEKSISTEDIWGFDNQEAYTDFALRFSKENNIVDSSDWANLRDENGLDGAPIGNTNNLGNKHSEETKRVMSVQKAGENNPFFGRQHTEETKKMMSVSHAGYSHQKESKDKISKSYKEWLSKNPHPKEGTLCSKETKDKIRIGLVGKRHTEERKTKLSDAASRRPDVTCPHCGKIGKINQLSRWHFNNCKTLSFTSSF